MMTLIGLEPTGKYDIGTKALLARIQTTNVLPDDLLSKDPRMAATIAVDLPSVRRSSKINIKYSDFVNKMVRLVPTVSSPQNASPSLRSEWTMKRMNDERHQHKDQPPWRATSAGHLPSFRCPCLGSEIVTYAMVRTR